MKKKEIGKLCMRVSDAAQDVRGCVIGKDAAAKALSGEAIHLAAHSVAVAFALVAGMCGIVRDEDADDLAAMLSERDDHELVSIILSASIQHVLEEQR